MSVTVLGGIVLAAGASRRMGTSKAFLEIDGRTFIVRALELLRAASCAEIVVVCPPGERERYTEAVGEGIVIVENPRPERGMLSTLGIGFDSLGEKVTHALVTLVDTPLISVETARLVAAEIERFPHQVLVPQYKGAPGHPVTYPRAIWAPLAKWDGAKWGGAEGARGFLAANPSLVAGVEVPDPAILQDLDTPADARKAGAREGFVRRG